MHTGSGSHCARTTHSSYDNPTVIHYRGKMYMDVSCLGDTSINQVDWLSKFSEVCGSNQRSGFQLKWLWTWAFNNGHGGSSWNFFAVNICCRIKSLNLMRLAMV